LSHNLYDLFSAKFSVDLTAPFLTTPDGTSYNYGQLDRRSAAMAQVLADNGAQPGDRIVAQVDKSADAIALYMACLRGGFVYVPLNVAYTPDEVGFFLGDADPAVFVCKPNRLPKLRPVAEIADVPGLLTLSAKGTGSLAEAANAAPYDLTVAAREASDLACMVYTSGTTGRSKGAMLTHGAIAANARALHAIWQFRPGDVLLHTLPIFHIHGLFVALHTAMLNGSEVLLLPKFDVDAVRALLPRATVFMGVPTFYSRLLAQPDFGAADCANVRLFTSGSAPLPEPVFHSFLARTGHTITERYGMTETGIIASNPPDGQQVAGTVGYALPQVDLRIADEKDEPLEQGQIGEIQIQGPHLFAGYWGLDNKTAESYSGDHFFKTGDLGSIGPDGRLALVGRTSDLIISGGYNVYPKEVELALDSQAGVIESAVVGLEHGDLGEAVVAFVVLDHHPRPVPPEEMGITGEVPVTDADAELDLDADLNGDPGIDLTGQPDGPPSGIELDEAEQQAEAALRAALSEKLANYKQPRAYIFLPSLPRNTMGKIQKVVLRESHTELFSELNL
jgi:malonyl-CoA/methylmalonyl-CoA synthetase